MAIPASCSAAASFNGVCPPSWTMAPSSSPRLASTRAISELRLTIEYESASAWNRMFSAGSLSLDIVDYPGEWLLDLPLLGKDYATWSRDTLAVARLLAARGYETGLDMEKLEAAAAFARGLREMA